MTDEHLGEDQELLAVIVWLRVVWTCTVAGICGKVHASSKRRDGAERAREVVVDDLTCYLLRRAVEQLLHIRARLVATLHNACLFLKQVPLREILHSTHAGYGILVTRAGFVKALGNTLVLRRFWDWNQSQVCQRRSLNYKQLEDWV